MNKGGIIFSSFSEKKRMEYNVHKEQYGKLKESIKDIFKGTKEELNMRIESYDTILKEKDNEITEVKINMILLQ
jgi:hypothetical protein